MRNSAPQAPSLCSRIPKHMIPFNGGRNAEELKAYLDCILTVAEEQQWNRAKLLAKLRPISCDRFLSFLTYEVEPNWEVSHEFNDRQRFRRVCVHCLIKPLEEIQMEMQIGRLLEGENLYDALRRINRYGRISSFPKTDLCLENLRRMLRVRPEVIHLTISCTTYQQLASQALSLLSVVDNKLTKLPLHPQPVSISAFRSSASSQQCSHCNKKGHSDRSCWKLHPEQKPIRGQLFQYLQEIVMNDEQHMARPAGRRPPRAQRSTSPRIVRPRVPSAEGRRVPKPAHVLNQFPRYMSNPEIDAQIRDNLMPPSVPMTKAGQRDSPIQILWSNLMKTKIPVPASVLLAMTPNRQEQQNAIQNALSDALHQRLLTSSQGRNDPGFVGGGSGRPVIESSSSESEARGASGSGLNRPGTGDGSNIDITTLLGSSRW